MSELAEVLARAIASGVADIWTMGPGRIKTYDPVTERADVEHLVMRPIARESGEITNEALPISPNVPVVFPRGGGVSITWTVAPGDVVILIASTYAIGQWAAAPLGLTEPGDVRQHHPGSVLALPLTMGLASPAGAGTLSLGTPGATEPAVLGAGLEAWLTAIIAGVTGAGGTVTPPVDYPTLGDILSAKVRVG